MPVDPDPLAQIEEEEDDAPLQIDDGHGPAHIDSEGIWLISYADLMTLLMGFFALMVSMASFEEEQFSKVADETAKYFGGEIEEPYEELADKIKKVIEEKGLQDQIQTEVKKTEVQLTFKGTLFFDSGSISLKEGATVLMNEIISVLDESAKDKKFIIEGHTDDVPINQGVIASNWELSSLRSAAVARLFEKYGFERNQILTLGHGETRPKVPNRDDQGTPIPENMSENRRVVLKIMNKLPL